MRNDLICQIERLHTTELGRERIIRNLGLDAEDVVLWCKQFIMNAQSIVQKGKNWYVDGGEITITVNAHSFTIITAHRKKRPAPHNSAVL